jgi:NADH-quinone oxidoreductase subunit K
VINLAAPLLLSAGLMCAGIYGVLARRNAVLVLMSIELMLAAVNINLVAFDAFHADSVHGGQVFALFVIAIAAAEAGVGLAIALQLYRARGSISIDLARSLADDPSEQR